MEYDWESVEPGIWKPNKVGDFIQGVLISKESKGSFDSEAYSIETETEGFKLVWGSTVLADRMKFINIGDIVRIEFKGVEKNKLGQDVKIFKVSRGTPKKQ
jgi:hypothetical protein